jgi:hypothetical protein
MKWLSILYILLTLTYFLGLLLAAVNELLDGSDKATIKRRIEDFWFFTAELSTTQKLSEALKARKDGTMPPTLLMLVIYIFALVAVFTTGGLIDFSTFDVVDLRNFMIAHLALSSTGALLTPIISAWLIYNTFGFLYHPSIVMVTIVIATVLQVRELLSDLLRIARTEFAIGIVPGAINWAIFTDVSYSIYYLVPSVLLVMAQR